MKTKRLEIIALSIAVVGIVSLVSFLLVIFFNDYRITGDLGDHPTEAIGAFIGGVVGCFFSLASIVLFYAALKTQQNELRKSIELFEMQSSISKQQQFEATFFQFFKLFVDKLPSVKEIEEMQREIEAGNEPDFQNHLYEGPLKEFIIHLRNVLTYISKFGINKSYFIDLVRSRLPYAGELILAYLAYEDSWLGKSDFLIVYKDLELYKYNIQLTPADQEFYTWALSQEFKFCSVVLQQASR